MEIKGNAKIEGNLEVVGETVAKAPDAVEILRERLKTFYKCRDLEISNLWQRSVFLGAFLLLCFTGYGYLILGNLPSFWKVPGTGGAMQIESTPFCSFVNLTGLALAVIGQTMSIIWILMGKGSKRWYEVYEAVICKLENNPALQIPEEYRMGVYCDESATDERMLNLQGGKYSPSKLNICIGYVSLAIWTLVFTLHVACLLFDYFCCFGLICCLLSFFAAFSSAAILSIILGCCTKSSC